MPVASVKFPDRDALIVAVKKVLAQYAGTAVTLRQLYYRLVAAGAIPNSLRSYKNLGAAMTLWRRRREIPTRALEDRTRGMNLMDVGQRHDDPMGWMRAYLDAGLRQGRDYHLARWYGQDKRVVVAVEKQALEGPFTKVCEDLDVDLSVCRGYPSISFLQELADALRNSHNRENIVLYFGDHDPSGENIPEVVERDLSGMFRQSFTLTKVALTDEQAEEMSLIPAPVKLGDSRSSRFVEEHGEEVFELDAIEPEVLQTMIREAVEEHFDDAIAEERDELEENGKRAIGEVLEKYNVGKLMADLAEGSKAGEE